MKVKCIANSGAGFKKYTMEHMGCSVNTQLPLCVNETYTVYGQMIHRGILQYLIKGTNENLPSWYPAELFKVVSSQLYIDWLFGYDSENEISAIWGFDELVSNTNFVYDLVEREDYAINIFLKRKKQMDEFEE